MPEIQLPRSFAANRGRAVAASIRKQRYQATRNRLVDGFSRTSLVTHASLVGAIGRSSQRSSLRVIGQGVHLPAPQVKMLLCLQNASGNEVLGMTLASQLLRAQQQAAAQVIVNL